MRLDNKYGYLLAERYLPRLARPRRIELAAVELPPHYHPTRDQITTCSAENLIVHKAFAGRDKDWATSAETWLGNQSHLDRRQIARYCFSTTNPPKA